MEKNHDGSPSTISFLAIAHVAVRDGTVIQFGSDWTNDGPQRYVLVDGRRYDLPPDSPLCYDDFMALRPSHSPPASGS